MLTLDLNCDLGESFGAWKIGEDEKIIPLITSANIACGFHGGDPTVMANTVALALEHQVAIGAHPSLPDLQGFGRRRMGLTPKEIYHSVIYQIGALLGFLKAMGGTLHHVKPHGALYHMASEDKTIALAIIKAIQEVTNGEAKLYALANSPFISIAKKEGLKVVNEVFADRSYQDDGTLTSRDKEGAVINSYEAAIQQVLEFLIMGTVTTLSNKKIPIQAETLCIHGDNPHALIFIKNLRQQLIKKGVRLQPPS